MSDSKLYDVTITGGGLAGLSLSIQLAKAGYKTILFEKEKYPFHKVCGEYISLESWDFLERIGVPLSKMSLPVISKLIVSSADGRYIHNHLDMGGFGISRFTIDNILYELAKQNGVEVYEGRKVNDIFFRNDAFTISTSAGSNIAKVAAGAYGKRSNLDARWSRSFIKQRPGKLNNYIGVKYHIRTGHPADTIALHNFKDGYCGLSKIEEDKYSLCYLTTAKNLKENDNSISAMEKNILQQNPFLKKIFTESVFLNDAPVTISQISFEKKSLVEDHVLMIGDAAGMITPLCGNGMSMAMHSGKIAFECIDDLLQGKITRAQMENQYKERWNKNFSKRLRNGRSIQNLFGKKWPTDLLIRMARPFSSLVKAAIRSVHGESF